MCVKFLFYVANMAGKLVLVVQALYGLVPEQNITPLGLCCRLSYKVRLSGTDCLAGATQNRSVAVSLASFCTD
jgi:hypothetical protein